MDCSNPGINRFLSPCLIAFAAASLALSAGCNRHRSGGGPEGTTASDAPDTERQTAAQVQDEKIAQANEAKDAGDYERALSLFREILARNPTVTTAYLGIGDIYMEQEDYASAEPNYAKAARLEPRNFDAQYGHGLALQLLNRFLEAIRAYHRALVIRPNSADTNLNIATTYLQMGEARGALAYAEKAVELEPDNGAARVNLGAVYDQLGIWDQAIETYRTAMELTEPTPELVMNLVKVLGEAGRYRETIDAAETLNRMSPTPNAYERMGWAWFKLKDFEQSEQSYRDAVGLDADHWPSWNGIGINRLNAWLLSKKRDDQARQAAGDALRQSLRINPRQQNVIELISTYRL